MSNPSVSSHANSASTEDSSSGSPPQPFPRYVHNRVLSNPPTEDPYIKKSVFIGLLNATQRRFFAKIHELMK